MAPVLLWLAVILLDRMANAKWIRDADSVDLKVIGLECTNGNTPAVCRYRACSNWGLCDPECILKETCQFAFDGPMYQDRWSATLEISPPQRISRWRLQTMFPNHALKAAHLEVQNQWGIWNKIIDSDITICRFAKGTSQPLGSVYISKVKIVISETPTQAEVDARTGGHGHSSGQIYLYNVDFHIGSSCGAGEYPTYENQGGQVSVACKKCEPGRYGEEGFPCTDCLAGKYSRETGLPHPFLCKTCEPGYYSLSPGAVNCLACEPGRATRNRKPNETCASCASGMYQDEAGRVECKLCGKGTPCDALEKTVETKYKALRSPIPRDVAFSVTTNKPSNAMMEAELVRDAVISWRILDSELNMTKFSAIESFDIQISFSQNFETSFGPTYNVPAEERSFALSDIHHSIPLWDTVIYARVSARTAGNGTSQWSEETSPWRTGKDCPLAWLDITSPQPQDWDCRDCPEGASCSGTPWLGVKAKFGYYRIPSTTFPHRFVPCLYPAACLGAPNDAYKGQYYVDEQDPSTDLALANVPDMCHTSWGHANGSRLCHTCRPGFSRQGALRCTKCLPTSNWINVAVIVITLLAVILYLRSSMNEKQQEYAISDNIKKVMLNYLQVITQFSAFSLHWPPIMQALFESQGVASTVGPQILNLECLSSMTTGELFYAEQIASALMPLIIGLVVYLVWRIVAKHKKEDFGKRKTAKSVTYKDKWIMSTFVIFYLMYPSMTKMAFELFNCIEVEKGLYFLLRNMEDECFVGHHYAFAMVVGLFQIVAYVIGLPLVVFFFLHRNRHNLSSNAVNWRYGLFLNGYRKEKYYWELTIVARKVVVIVVSVFGKLLGPQLQSHILSAAILLCLVGQSTGRPFISEYGQPSKAKSSNNSFEIVHRLEIMSLFIIWLTLWCGLFIYHLNRQHSHLHGILTVGIFVANLGVMLLMVWHFAVAIVYEFKKLKKNKVPSAGMRCVTACTEKIQTWWPCLKMRNSGSRAHFLNISSFKTSRRFRNWRIYGTKKEKKTSGPESSSHKNPIHDRGEAAAAGLEMTNMSLQHGSKRISSGWIVCEDQDTGDKYFYNQWTEESVWADTSREQVPQPGETHVPEVKSEEWTQLIDEETQRAYWYNASTGESLWVDDEDNY